MPRTEQILSLEIDNDGRLHVKPADSNFAFIYRSGREVNWDADKKTLFSPKPREWGYLKWFQNILAACEAEYAVKLSIFSGTEWINVPDALRKEIENA